VNLSERVGPVTLTWEPQPRIATLRFVEEGVGGREEAEQLTRALDGWVGEDLYGLLVDCSEMVDVDAGWRTTWGEYYRTNRDQATIAWFDANARIRLVILMFRRGTGVHGRSFGDEADARAWLEDELGRTEG
jgi:hypothetical protein